MKKFFLMLLRGYQKFVSPLKRQPSCRFYPTCSSYAMEALERFGTVKGLWLSIRRILRCNPYCKGGIDRVPEEFYWFRVNPEIKKSRRENQK